MNIIIGYILTYTYIIGVLLLITLLQKKSKIKTNTTRKLIHILVGLSWFIMTYYFKNTIHLIIPPLSFILINYISYKKNLISSMENNHSKGTIYYALSFFALSLITYFNNDFLPFYGLGVLTMTIGDGLAPIIGSKFPKHKIGKTKNTYAGSLTVLLSGLLLAIIFNQIYILSYNILDYIIIGIFSVILELFDYHGTDNLTLPIGVAIISYLLTF